MRMERRHEPEKLGRPRLKRALTIGLVVLGVLILVAALVVTGVLRMGAAKLDLDRDTYHTSSTVAFTLRNASTGVVVYGYSFRVQRFEGDDWVNVPVAQGPVPDIALSLRTGEAFKQSFVPTRDFAETPQPGRYRVVKDVAFRPLLERPTRGTFGPFRPLVAEFQIIGR